MNEELRPCPFCGEMPITENNFAACANKSCPTYDNYWTNPQILTIEHWNTRPIEDALRARIVRLKAFIDQLIEAGESMSLAVECENQIEANAYYSWKELVKDWKEG